MAQQVFHFSKKLMNIKIHKEYYTMIITYYCYNNLTIIYAYFYLMMTVRVAAIDNVTCVVNV